VTTVRIAHPIGGRPSPDQFGKVFHVASPIQDTVGVITPSSLHYIATTRGSYMPDIDPKTHTVMIHGLVDQPLTFTMDDLKRFHVAQCQPLMPVGTAGHGQWLIPAPAAMSGPSPTC
jgi:sulfane dehydrogenase subunit SoxC